MTDPYDHKPVPNLRISDVVGLVVVAGVAGVGLYLIFMLVWHWIFGHPPP